MYNIYNGLGLGLGIIIIYLYVYRMNLTILKDRNTILLNGSHPSL